MVLHDLRVIQWKPTVFFWLASVAFLASHWIGRQTLTQRLLTAALGGEIPGNEARRVADSTWKRLNLLWVAFYALLGGLNLLVAFNFSEHAWVTFKVVGLPIVNLAFVGAQVAWLLRRSSAGSHVVNQS